LPGSRIQVGDFVTHHECLVSPKSTQFVNTHNCNHEHEQLITVCDCFPDVYFQRGRMSASCTSRVTQCMFRNLEMTSNAVSVHLMMGLEL